MYDDYQALLYKLVFGIYIWISTNFYLGAFLIAGMSAITRSVYDSTKCATCGLQKFPRYFILSLALAMLMLHVGLAAELSNNEIIVISAIFAFMSEETMYFIVTNWGLILAKLSSRIGK